MTISRLKTAFSQLLEHKTTPLWPLAGITLLAAGLRFYKLGEWSFWIDEIYTINRAQIHFSDLATMLRTLPATLWLPVSVIFTEGFLKVFGVNEWSARLASTLIGIISIPILFFATRKIIETWTALTLALLLAVSPWHLFWSQNARFYTSLLLLYTLAGLQFYKAIEFDKPKNIFIFYLLLYFALSERMLAILLLPAVLVYLAALVIFRYEKPAGFNRRNFLFTILPMFGLGVFDALRLGLTGSSFVLDTFNDFFGKAIDSPIRILILILYNIGIPLACLALLSAIYFIKEKNRLGLFLAINAIFTTLLVVAISQFTFVVDRFVFMTLPSWIILAAFCVIDVHQKYKAQGILLAVGALLILIADAGSAHLMYYQLNHGNRPEWRQAFEFVMERARVNDVLVSSVDNVGSYYAKRDVVALGDFNPMQIAGTGQRVWFVLDFENSWFAGEQKEWVEDNADLLEIYYLRVRERMFLKIYYYDENYSSPK